MCVMTEQPAAIAAGCSVVTHFYRWGTAVDSIRARWCVCATFQVDAVATASTCKVSWHYKRKIPCFRKQISIGNKNLIGSADASIHESLTRIDSVEWQTCKRDKEAPETTSNTTMLEKTYLMTLTWILKLWVDFSRCITLSTSTSLIHIYIYIYEIYIYSYIYIFRGCYILQDCLMEFHWLTNLQYTRKS